MRSQERKQWAKGVLKQLRSKADLETDRFTILVGKYYREHLLHQIRHYEIPMEGLRQGEQLQFLKRQLTTSPKKKTTRKSVKKRNNAALCICSQIHNYAQQLERYCFPFDISKIPSNGLYLLFEDGELDHNGDRIVRIGTHTGPNKLPGRIKEHFITPNKDRSIFRKNIGRALLNQREDTFLEQWEIDLTSRKNRAKYAHKVDPKRLVSIEQEVTEYITSHFSFAIIPVEGEKERLALESDLIATTAQCNDCAASDDWFGKYSPKPKIAQSGLWQVQHLKGCPLTQLPSSIANL